MPREFVEFQADLERQVRERLAKECRFSEARSQEWILRGSKVTFYQNAWLAYLAPRQETEAERRYFVIDFGKRNRRPRHVIPIANASGAIDRVNRELQAQGRSGEPH